MRPARIRISLIPLILFSCSGLAEIKASESTAIGQYISERKKIQANAAPVVEKMGAQAMGKLDQMEKRLFPISVWIEGQIAEMIASEAAIERREKELKEQEKFNPYEDKSWKEAAHKDLVQMCCEIKADPRRQQQIINRVAQGYPAIPPNNQRNRGAANGQGNLPRQGQGGNFGRAQGQGAARPQMRGARPGAGRGGQATGRAGRGGAGRAGGGRGQRSGGG